MRVSLALVFLLFSLSGCDLLTQETYQLEIRTDAERYTASDSVAVHIVNQDEETLYVRCDLQAYLLEFKGTRVDEAWPVGGRVLCYQWVALAQGDTVTVGFRPEQVATIFQPTQPKFDGDTRYRVEVEVYRGQYDKEMIPVGERRSNRFRVSR